MLEHESRRAFLVWIAAHGAAIAAAQQHAHNAVEAGGTGRFTFFKPEEAAEVEAVAAQIIPSDDTPGAREAGVVYFIDRALSTFDKDQRPAYGKGLEELARKTREMFPPAERFSSLSPDHQAALLRSIEKSEFFLQVHKHTLIGMFANPEYGGNRDRVGWKLIGFEDAFEFKPPFGYYDRESAK
jgi:gluconate 2-dehydrogenase gamma chain